LKENVIVGHLIPAGSGFRGFADVLVGNQEELAHLMAGYKKEEAAAVAPAPATASGRKKRETA
jgi:DNA-directed RNA polymerase subunit beta'